MAKFDPASRAVIRDWVEKVTKLKFKSSDFYESLSDGVMLCEYVIIGQIYFQLGSLAKYVESRRSCFTGKIIFLFNI